MWFAGSPLRVKSSFVGFLSLFLESCWCFEDPLCGNALPVASLFSAVTDSCVWITFSSFDWLELLELSLLDSLSDSEFAKIGGWNLES